MPADAPKPAPLALLSLGALGVVYGDIGTSPLYALKACFAPEYGLLPTAGNVAGLISLIIWALTFVVSIKYIAFIMRADNHGEGGIFALLALLRPPADAPVVGRSARVLVVLGLIGAALLYGDGVITPAISVLSAVEGINVATTAFSHFVVPASLVILVVLFAAQRFGTARIGGIFGPLMLFWFAVLGVLGAWEIVQTPAILAAINPLAAAGFLATHGTHGLLVLGAVVLAVTGAEALYADMGHFGRQPIRVAWFAIVFPALVLNYLGQGALLLRTPAAVSNPFYLLAPSVLLYPMVVLSTVATVIASQALLSGAFSLTQQAMLLGYSPRMRIQHTSAEMEGQIFVPFVNTTLMFACLLLVVTFQSSDRLAAAYGIAVTGTMSVTSLLFYVVARQRWQWSVARAGLLTAIFLTVDLVFLGTNLLKIPQGGWVPISLGALVYLLMSTWSAGHERLLELRREGAIPFDDLFRTLDDRHVARVPGAAVFFSVHPHDAPAVLLRYALQTKALQQVVILLGVTTAATPEVPASERLSVEPLSHGFLRATARVGFMQSPNAEEVIAELRRRYPEIPADDVVYFTSREQVLTTKTGGMFRWRKRLFALMNRNAGSAADFFSVPSAAVIELGTQVAF